MRRSPYQVKAFAVWVVVQFDVEAALCRQPAIPQTRDRRYDINLYHYRNLMSLITSPQVSIISHGKHIRFSFARIEVLQCSKWLGWRTPNAVPSFVLGECFAGYC
jgi:hypothetical protein